MHSKLNAQRSVANSLMPSAGCGNAIASGMRFSSARQLPVQAALYAVFPTLRQKPQLLFGTSIKSDTDYIGKLVEVVLKRLLHLQCFLDVVIHKRIAADADDTVADALFQQINGIFAHLACEHAVAHGR